MRRRPAETEPAISSRQAWFVFAIVYLGSAVGPFNQFKVPPLIPVLLTELHLSEVQAGLLMSIFSVSGLILSVPSGLLFRRFGPRVLGTVAVASSGVGSALGALSSGPTLLLVGRLIEGMGLGMTAVFAIVTIVAWFPPNRRDLPMGIYTTWIPVGQVLIFAVAPRVYAIAGWRAVWWVGSIAGFVCALLFALFVRLPAGSAMARPTADAPPFSQIFREPGPWLLAIFFGTFHVARSAFGTWTPTYLVQAAGWSLADASSTVSLAYLVSIPAAIPGGWLVTRLRSRKRAYLLSAGVAIPVYAVSYAIDPRFIGVAAVSIGLCAAIVPTAVNAATPESVTDRSLTGPATGAVNLGRNGGQLLAPLLIAPLVEAGVSWIWVGVLIAIVSVLGLVAGALVRVPRRSASA